MSLDSTKRTLEKISLLAEENWPPDNAGRVGEYYQGAFDASEYIMVKLRKALGLSTTWSICGSAIKFPSGRTVECARPEGHSDFHAAGTTAWRQA